jgi:hypothetical protein
LEIADSAKIDALVALAIAKLWLADGKDAKP